MASVAIFTTRDMKDVRSIALDTSSRTSVALTRVVCARVFGIEPAFAPHAPELPEMLAEADAALVIGDKALFLNAGPVTIGHGAQGRTVQVEKIDLGDLWLKTTGLPFVYAFWAGRSDVIGADEVRALIDTRDRSQTQRRTIAELYYPDDPARQDVAERYLRDNIKYFLGPDERAGLERFYHYAAEAGAIARVVAPTYFESQS